MQLNEGGWSARVGFPRRTMTAVRMKRPLPYWWCITLACHREFGGPWIDALFTGTWIRTRILSLPRLLICAFRRIV